MSIQSAIDATERVNALAPSIAAALGVEWFADCDDSHGWTLTDHDGRALRIDKSWRQPDRLEVQAWYPPHLREYSSHSDTPPRTRITVAATKNAVQIAADITGRLLPAYTAELERRREQFGEAAAKSDRVRAVCDALTAASNRAMVICNFHGEKDRPGCTSFDMCGMDISARVTGYGTRSVEMTISATPAQAEAIVRLLAQWEAA